MGGRAALRYDARRLAAAARLDALVHREPNASLAGALLVACLRLAGRTAEAKAQLAHWRSVDPTSSVLRYEQARLDGGDADRGLWSHLAADPNRILDLVDEYAALGAWADARDLLEREYPAVEEPMREPGVVSPSEHVLLAYYRAFARERLGLPAAGDYRRAAALPAPYVFPSRASTYAVLRSALRADADDSMARFLLGSLYFSGGLVDEAIGEWQRARALRPAIPTLHRNLGLALLLGTGDAPESRRVFEEGLRYDARNVEIYEGLDRVLSLLGAPAGERVAALRRYPSQPDMPPGLVFKLALALAEQGDSNAAEALFRNRFFPREEGGTSVRAVFAQVRLRRAETAAYAGRCADALHILDSFDHETPGLEFTRGGLTDLLQPAIVQRQVAAIESACGREDQARGRLTRLSRTVGPDSGPLQIALAYEAARMVGDADGGAWHLRLLEALDAASRSLEAGATSAPGTLRLASGLLLRALGREAEAARALADVFKLPDRNLSYFFARSALSSRPQGGR